MDIVNSREELIAAIRAGFEHPERLAEGRKRIVREICTYDDGRCTERLDRALQAFLTERGVLT